MRNRGVYQKDDNQSMYCNLTPEKNLVCKIVERAWDDIIKYYDGEVGSRKYLIDAYRWLFNMNVEDEHNAYYLCSYAGILPELDRIQQEVLRVTSLKMVDIFNIEYEEEECRKMRLGAGRTGRPKKVVFV